MEKENRTIPMRNEQEMYQLFLDIANNDDRILAVYMNGSRTNKNAPKDIFQDYDIVYVVEKTADFINDLLWITQFGDIMYMQYPDESPDYPNDKENFYGWLMQFKDGIRVDLHVESTEHALQNIEKDKLCQILLDKKGILPLIGEPTDQQYWVQKPTAEQYTACCNEFWWCSNNIAKGLWRKEIPYVQDMANYVVRKQLEKMLSWKIGYMTDYQVSVGKSAKYMYRWLSGEEYQLYLDTYFGGRVDEAWKSVMLRCDLFENTALWVAEHSGYVYNQDEGKAARAFLVHIRNLPPDSTEI